MRAVVWGFELEVSMACPPLSCAEYEDILRRAKKGEPSWLILEDYSPLATIRKAFGTLFGKPIVPVEGNPPEPRIRFR
jgi:hypothetical protein